jgi:hypothetical protein
MATKMSAEERAKAIKKAMRENNAYASTLCVDGKLPSREAAQLVQAHWLKLTKGLR